MTDANPILDQIDAAAHDAANRLRTVGENNAYEVRNFGPIAKMIVAGWFENAGADPDQQAMCEHVGGAPQVVFAAAPFPGVVTCADCFTKLWRVYTGLMLDLGKGRPCDGCHQFAEEGKTGIVSVGPMLMTVSMCGVCCVIEDAGTPQ